MSYTLAMDLFELFEKRRSIRAFESAAAVRPEDLEEILDALVSAPSAGNLQSFQVVVAKSITVRRDLARAAHGQDFIAEAPVVLVFCADPGNASKKYGTRGRELYSVQDATIACSFAMLAVTAVGLATVWVGAFDEDSVRDAAGIPPGLRPVAMLPIGMAKESPAPRPRRPLADLVRNTG